MPWGSCSVILCEGIADALFVLVSALRNTDACGLYGADRRQPLFRRAGACAWRSIATRSPGHRAHARVRHPRRVLIPSEELGPKGDLNDWLRVQHENRQRCPCNQVCGLASSTSSSGLLDPDSIGECCFMNRKDPTGAVEGEVI